MAVGALQLYGIASCSLAPCCTPLSSHAQAAAVGAAKMTSENRDLASLRELVSSTDELFSTLQRVESNGDVRIAGSRPSSVQLLLSNDEGGDDALCAALLQENAALQAEEADLARRVGQCDAEIASLRAAKESVAGASGAVAAVPAGSAAAADADDDTSIDPDDL